MTTLAVTSEVDYEPRVAASPDTVKKLTTLGCQVRIQSGAGLRSMFTDAMYQAQGATITPDMSSAVRDADIILKVRRPEPAEISAMKSGAILACMLSPHDKPEGVQAIARQGVSAFAMELMPRISRAQSMDVLSSQANLAGYRAVVMAANAFGQALPMMMTPAGTVPAAKVFIMGVGVAGLQAIATARRMGAIVTATDVRPATKEQVASLGAKFVAVEDEEFKQAETTAGYAKPMSAEYQVKQAALIANHLKSQDIVITTALIPGRAAPRLITAAMLDGMKPGSIIIDMAASRGGNCELSVSGQTTIVKGVKILGPRNPAGDVPGNASSLYARNLYAFLEVLFDKKAKVLKIDWDDEIVKGTLVTKDGQIVHPRLAAQKAA
jgi:H+-translocating NAD(P) transhydrogenase subunit alpha